MSHSSLYICNPNAKIWNESRKLNLYCHFQRSIWNRNRKCKTQTRRSVRRQCELRRNAIRNYFPYVWSRGTVCISKSCEYFQWLLIVVIRLHGFQSKRVESCRFLVWLKCKHRYTLKVFSTFIPISRKKSRHDISGTFTSKEVIVVLIALHPSIPFSFYLNYFWLLHESNDYINLK